MLARRLPLVSAVVASLLAPVAPALAVENVECSLGDSLRVDGDRLETEFTCPGGEAGELTLELGDVVGLDQADLEIVVTRLADPKQPTVALPDGVFIPPAFPIEIAVSPSVDADFAFDLQWELELHTEDLEYTADTPFRLFRSNGVDPYYDVTTALSSGSYRVKTFGGSFSLFVIAADLRRPRKVVAEKLAELRQYLGDLPVGGDGDVWIDSGVRDDLEGRRGAAESGEAAEDFGAARNAIDDFLALLLDAAIAGKVDRSYDASRDTTPKSVYGELKSRAASLRLALETRRERAEEPPGAGFRVRRTSLGGREVELTLVFEGGTDLTPEDFTIEVRDLSNVSTPTLDAVAARLPEGVKVPDELPLLVVIEPSSAAAHWFSDAFELQVTTADLALAAGRRLGLFKAADDATPFHEVSSSVGVGSYRVKGFGGSFSQFVIGEDGRDRAGVAAAKLDALYLMLEAGFEDGGIGASAAETLKGDLDAIGGELAADPVSWSTVVARTEAALATLDDLVGNGVRGVWANGGGGGGALTFAPTKGLVETGLRNWGGELRSLLESLRFDAVSEAHPLAPAAGDVDGDGDVDVADVLLLIGMVYGTGE